MIGREWTIKQCSVLKDRMMSLINKISIWKFKEVLKGLRMSVSGRMNLIKTQVNIKEIVKVINMILSRVWIKIESLKITGEIKRTGIQTTICIKKIRFKNETLIRVINHFIKIGRTNQCIRNLMLICTFSYVLPVLIRQQPINSRFPIKILKISTGAMFTLLGSRVLSMRKWWRTNLINLVRLNQLKWKEIIKQEFHEVSRISSSQNQKKLALQ